MSFFDEKKCDYLCSAYTDFYSTTFYFDTKSESINKVIELIQGIIRGRFLNDFDIEKIRKDILQEYESYVQNTFQADFHILLEDTEYEHHLPIGTRRCISDFSKEEIWEFYKEFYCLGNMCIVWIGSPQDIEEIGTEWIENLDGIYGETKQNILDYKFVNGRVAYLVEEKEIRSMDCYYFRERDKQTNSMDETIIMMLEKVLNRYVGEVKVEKIYLSYMQEFIHIQTSKCRKEKEMGEIFKKVPLEDWVDLYRDISNTEPTGCNCNSLREFCINSFIFNVQYGNENTDIESEVNTLLNMLEMNPIIIFR